MKFVFAFPLAVIGYFAGGPVSAILCFLVGVAIDFFSSNENETKEKPKTQNAVDLSKELLVLIAHVMKADGNLKKSELSLVKQLLVRNYGQDKAIILLQELKWLLNNEFSIFAACKTIRNSISYHQRFELLTLLFRVARADNEVHMYEIQALSQISAQLGLHNADFARLQAIYANTNYQYYNPQQHVAKSNIKSAYDVLEIPITASEIELKKAFRKKAMLYHPDMLNGKPTKEREIAEQKFLEIKRAYESIKESKGWE